MSTQITSRAYDGLIDEDLAWLKGNTDRSLERDHIEQILNWAKRHYKESPELYSTRKPDTEIDNMDILDAYTRGTVYGQLDGLAKVSVRFHQAYKDGEINKETFETTVAITGQVLHDVVNNQPTQLRDVINDEA